MEINGDEVKTFLPFLQLHSPLFVFVSQHGFKQRGN